jgi:hypothetical protein
MTEITYGITGASGQLARIAAEELRVAGVRPLVLGTRDPSALGTTALAQDDVRRVNFDEPSTLTSGLAGVDRLLIVSTDHLSVTGARVTQHRNALNAALDRKPSTAFAACRINRDMVFGSRRRSDLLLGEVRRRSRGGPGLAPRRRRRRRPYRTGLSDDAGNRRNPL